MNIPPRQRNRIVAAFALGLLALLLALPAAAPLTSYRLDVGGQLDAPFISGMGLPGVVDSVSYRWSDGAASVRLPALDTFAPLLVSVRTGANWWPTATPLTMTLLADGYTIAALPLHPGWDWYTATISPALLRSGLNLTIESDIFTDVNGLNQMGLPLDAISVQSLDPAPALDLWLPLALALAVLLATLLGMRRDWWLGLIVGLLAIATLTPALYLYRPLFALYISTVLAALAISLALAHFGHFIRRPASSNARVGIYLFVAALSIYLLLTPGQFSADDDRVKYLATESLLVRHSFVLPSPIYGATFSKYGLGTSLAEAPLLAPVLILEQALGTPLPALRQFSVTLLNPLLGALLVLLLYRTALLLYRRRDVAIGLALIGGGATTIFAYALLTSAELLLATLLLALAYCLLRYFGAGDSDNDTAKSLSPAGKGLVRGESRPTSMSGDGVWLIRAGLLMAALTLVKQEYALAGLLVVSWWLLRVRHAGMAGSAAVRGAVLLTAPLLLAIVANVGYNLLVNGDPLNPGYTATAFATPTISAELTGIYGMLASPGKSLFIYSPPLLLLPWAVVRFYRRHAWDAALWAAISLLLLLFYARLSFWSGDLAWGPRYIMPLTPLLLLPLGTLLLDFNVWRRGYKLAIGGLFALGGTVQLLSALVSYQAAFFADLPPAGDITAHYTAWQFIPWQSPLIRMAAMLFGGQINAPAITHLSSYGLPLLADYLAPAALLSLAVLSVTAVINALHAGVYDAPLPHLLTPQVSPLVPRPSSLITHHSSLPQHHLDLVLVEDRVVAQGGADLAFEAVRLDVEAARLNPDLVAATADEQQQQVRAAIVPGDLSDLVHPLGVGIGIVADRQTQVQAAHPDRGRRGGNRLAALLRTLLA